MFKLPKSRNWTFIVLRDDRRPSVQFKLERTVLLLVPLLALCLIITSIWLTQAYQKKNREHQHVVTQLEEKKETIESLQKDLISLSIQSEEIQEKMKYLEALEEEINQLTDISELEDAVSRSQKSADEHQQSLKLAALQERTEEEKQLSSDHPAKAIGGEYYGVSLEETTELTAKTGNSFAILRDEANEMKERLEQALTNVEAYQELMQATPSIWPTVSTRVTSNFGHRRDPFTGRRTLHSGIDLGGKTGDPIYATANGKVTAAGYHRSMGYYVTIDHQIGIQTRYLHLHEINVKQGDVVLKGDTIASLGSTGRSTGPHLHYEVIVDGTLVDPRPFMGLDEEE